MFLFFRQLMPLVLLLISSLAHAQGMDLFGGPLSKVAWVRLSGLELSPSNSESIKERALQASIPVLRTEKTTYRLTYKDEQLQSSSTQGILRSYANREFGAGYETELENDRSFGLSLSYGSASDDVFSQSDVTVLSATATYKAQEEGTGRWIYLVNYSNNRPFLNNIPLPGFAYIYRPNPQFFGVFGAPFASFNWQFADQWTWQVFGILPWILKTQLQYKIAGPVQAYAGVDFSQRTFFRKDRTEKEDRVFYDERKLLMGLKSPIHRRVFLDLEMGHVYNRRIFEAQNFEFESPGEMKLGQESYIKLSLMIFLTSPEVLRPQ